MRARARAGPAQGSRSCLGRCSGPWAGTARPGLRQPARQRPGHPPPPPHSSSPPQGPRPNVAGPPSLPPPSAYKSARAGSTPQQASSPSPRLARPPSPFPTRAVPLSHTRKLAPPSFLLHSAAEVRRRGLGAPHLPTSSCSTRPNPPRWHPPSPPASCPCYTRVRGRRLQPDPPRVRGVELGSSSSVERAALLHPPPGSCRRIRRSPPARHLPRLEQLAPTASPRL
ncbi:uncharacterized protein [Miscanthus floridulus]|uniref:uncharacterized protein n=1 Tax=Miscanthus floridulus TaxID=154761 RepID=UPI0034595B14